jgi:hypothetical protein
VIFSICDIVGTVIRPLLIALILLPMSLSKAEEKETAVNSWVTAGLGFGEPVGLAGSISANLRYKYVIGGARVIGIADVAGGFDLFECTDEMTEKAFLVGVATDILGPYVAAISVGISEVTGTICNASSRDRSVSTFGVPIDIQVLPKRRVGLALRGFININSERSFWGITLNLALGNLR